MSFKRCFLSESIFLPRTHTYPPAIGRAVTSTKVEIPKTPFHGCRSGRKKGRGKKGHFADRIAVYVHNHCYLVVVVVVVVVVAVVIVDDDDDIDDTDDDVVVVVVWTRHKNIF